MKREVLVPAMQGGACIVRRGESIRIVDVEGQQICDFVCFNYHNPEEKLSTGETVEFNLLEGNGTIYISVGSKIYSNLQNPMMEVTEDQANGSHDMLFPPCSSHFYAVYLGDPNHPNCRDNLTEAVKRYGLRYIDVPDPINIFQSSRPLEDGTIDFQPAVTEAGEYIELKALMDCIVAISACPFDQEWKGLRPNGVRCTPLKIEYV